MIIMSLRDGGFPSKQSPTRRGDCSPALAPGASVATCARNDIQTASLRELQSETQEELDALLPSAEGATIGRGV